MIAVVVEGHCASFLCLYYYSLMVDFIIPGMSDNEKILCNIWIRKFAKMLFSFCIHSSQRRRSMGSSILVLGRWVYAHILHTSATRSQAWVQSWRLLSLINFNLGAEEVMWPVAGGRLRGIWSDGGTINTSLSCARPENCHSEIYGKYQRCNRNMKLCYTHGTSGIQCQCSIMTRGSLED